VRSTSPQLLAALNSVLTRHVRRDEDGHLMASKFYNVVRARYFENASRFDRHLAHPFRFGRTGRVSPYDDLFRQAARDTGLDWRLLAALSFQESRFDPTAVSWAGAHGLMQLLPSTAGVSARALHDPDVNVPLGARHLRMLYDLYEDVPEPERLRFALAAYNCGQGHLDDARRLSSLLGKDPDVWEGSVRESLLLLRQPNFHRMVRYGYVRGNETVAYVREVERRYELLMAVSNRSSTARLVSAVEGASNDSDTPDMTVGARGLN
jgi:membrane-bound lytic murein transglycosylase F